MSNGNAGMAAGPVVGLWFMSAITMLFITGMEHGAIFYFQPLITTALVAGVLHCILLWSTKSNIFLSLQINIALGLISALVSLVLYSLSWGKGYLGVFLGAHLIVGITLVYGALVSTAITVFYLRKKYK
jgi:hypothetical protein